MKSSTESLPIKIPRVGIFTGSRSDWGMMRPASVILDELAIASDDQEEGVAVELSNLEEYLALSSSFCSADFFLKDTLGFSQPFGEIPS